MKTIFNPDLLAGIAALAWAVLAVDPDGAGDLAPLVPAFAALCSAAVAGPFGLVALGRWYAKVRKESHVTD